MAQIFGAFEKMLAVLDPPEPRVDALVVGVTHRRTLLVGGGGERSVL